MKLLFQNCTHKTPKDMTYKTVGTEKYGEV